MITRLIASHATAGLAPFKTRRGGLYDGTPGRIYDCTPDDAAELTALGFLTLFNVGTIADRPLPNSSELKPGTLFLDRDTRMPSVFDGSDWRSTMTGDSTAGQGFASEADALTV